MEGGVGLIDIGSVAQSPGKQAGLGEAGLLTDVKNGCRLYLVRWLR